MLCKNNQFDKLMNFVEE
jgi:intraflagellar transport protein 140